VFESDFERELGGRRKDRAKGRGTLASTDSGIRRFIHQGILARSAK